MRKIAGANLRQIIVSAIFILNLFIVKHVWAQASPVPTNKIQVNEGALGFKIPTLATILTFAIRAIFVIGGLLALVMLLLGAIAWITSGGEKENVSKAQNKLQAAVVGVILIAVVLAIIATLEQVIFKGTICLGLTCPITVPDLLKRSCIPEGGLNCVLPGTPGASSDMYCCPGLFCRSSGNGGLCGQ